jgi:polysaccharide export outer membrane protein
LSLWFLAAGCAAAATPAVAQTGREVTYLVGARDLLDVRVAEDDKFNIRPRVEENGTINVPYLGEVSVGGKTVIEIQQVLKTRLEERFMQRASVSVQVLEFRSRPISVIGAVQRPGDLAFSGRWTLLEALTAAGGLAAAHGGVVYVLRRADNGLSDQIGIDVNDLLVRGDPKVNIPIFANDLINVAAAVELTVYCLGEVNKPGALTFKTGERVTLLAAIASAGGLTDRASPKLLIKRRSGPQGTQEIATDYKRILAGKEPDLELAHGDVIVVKESFF